MKIFSAAAAFFLTGAALIAQSQVWAPKGQPAVYKGPHKPHTKLKDLRAKHAAHAEWREVIVDDAHLRSEYIQAKPGSRTRRALHPDTRAWWVVMDGEVKFDIESVGAVSGRKGSIIQVPMQTFYSWEVVGDKPALVFETNIAGAKTLYESAGAPTEKPPVGTSWIPVKFNNREIGVYSRNNKPHVHYDDVAKALEEGKLKGTIRLVQDDRGTANFIYGYNSKLPPVDPKNKGHYHPEGAEYWLIMSGQIRYPIEKVGVVIAEEGDVVYVPPYTWHAPRWWGDGPSCRLAMNGFPYISHLFDVD
ncbi:MAG: cupin domain-containing protein [Bryobacterales bacterium]|nr:cupin domain-containing protein [Bryobacterales bacterium]